MPTEKTRAAASPAQERPPARRALPAPLCSPDCAPVFEPVSRPLWFEAAWPWEWMGLHLSGVYWAVGCPRGRGGPVIVVPGFLASDLHLATLYAWLGRLGYRPYFSDIGRNADCPDVLLERLLETVDRASAETGQRVQLIGHSFGGVLARGAAVRHPDRVSQVVTLGSPFRALRAHPWVLRIARRLAQVLPSPQNQPRRHRDHTHASTCACRFLEDNGASWPSAVQRAAIYSRRDGVVDWRACREDDPRFNFEVRSSHSGLLFNAQVYRLLANLLVRGQEALGVG